MFAALRSGWRIGVLTNGVPAIQHRKVTALGLRACVDTVVFASECGQKTGKPDPAAFRTVLARLGVPPERSVFVGDDLQADIAGARRVGLHTIHVAVAHAGQGLRCAAVGPYARVTCLRAVPAMAEQLVPFEPIAIGRGRKMEGEWKMEREASAERSLPPMSGTGGQGGSRVAA